MCNFVGCEKEKAVGLIVISSEGAAEIGDYCADHWKEVNEKLTEVFVWLEARRVDDQLISWVF